MKLEILSMFPDGNEKRVPLLFIHGAFHGAWCWYENFMPYFSKCGYPCYAISLRAHGNSEGVDKLDDCGISDYVEDVISVLSMLSEKPVLIGHSMGGSIIQTILQDHQDEVLGAVLISSNPHDGLSFGVSMKMLMSGIKEMKQLYMFSRGKVDPMDENSGFPFKCFFSPTLSMEKQRKYACQMQQESMKVARGLKKGVIPDTDKNKLPILVIGGANDWFLPPSEYQRLAAAYHTKEVIVPDLSHNVMLDTNWEKAAEIIRDFLIENIG